ncbi:hypothetical protein ACTXT7_009220 [Hymenolepis weldensis]
MSNESEPVVNAVAAPMTHPVFDPMIPYENSFQLRGISKQKTMFQRDFSALPTDIAAPVIDIVDKASEVNFYYTLKRTVIFASQILKKNVCNSCSRKSNWEIALPLNFSVTCDPSWAKSE